MEKRDRLRLMSGGGKTWVVVLLLVFTAIYFGFFVVGPVYRAKWRLQDKMAPLLGRYAYYVNMNPDDPADPLLTDLQIAVDAQGLGFDTLEQFPDGSTRCFVQAELGGPGEIWCNYDAQIRFLGQERTMKMHAHTELDHVPRTSF